MTEYLEMAELASKYAAPGINIELECRAIIPAPMVWDDYTELEIPYFHSPKHPTLNIRRITGRRSDDSVRYRFETKELIAKLAYKHINIALSIEKQYTRFPDILVPQTIRKIQRKIVNQHPLTVINKENNIFMLEVEYDIGTVDLCKEIIDSYQIPMWPCSKPIDAYASEIISSIIHGKYFLSPKIDGEHVVIYANKKKEYLYITDNGQQGEKKSLSNSEKRKILSNPFTVMEAEMVNKDFYIFDVMISEQKKIVSLPLRERMKHVIVLDENFHIKRHHAFFSHKSLVRAYEKCKEINTVCDGTIMTNAEHYGSTVYKSKPVPTVDLQYIDGYLYLANEKRSTRIPASSSATFENGGIYEFDMGMNLIRKRDDKVIPNYRMPVEIDPITNIISGEGAPSLRYHHNAVKLKMLKMIPQTTLLDIGSGVGGDLDKWDTFDQVYALDEHIGLRHCPENVISLRCSTDNMPEIHYECMSLFFVPWDDRFLELALNAKHVVMIIMDNPKETNNLIYRVSTACGGGLIHLEIPGSTTACNITEKYISKTDIDTYMEKNGYECIHFKHDMSFGTKEEIELSNMYSYLYYKKK